LTQIFRQQTSYLVSPILIAMILKSLRNEVNDLIKSSNLKMAIEYLEKSIHISSPKHIDIILLHANLIELEHSRVRNCVDFKD